MLLFRVLQSAAQPVVLGGYCEPSSFFSPFNACPDCLAVGMTPPAAAMTHHAASAAGSVAAGGRRTSPHTDCRSAGATITSGGDWGLCLCQLERAAPAQWCQNRWKLPAWVSSWLPIALWDPSMLPCRMPPFVTGGWALAGGGLPADLYSGTTHDGPAAPNPQVGQQGWASNNWKLVAAAHFLPRYARPCI